MKVWFDIEALVNFEVKGVQLLSMIAMSGFHGLNKRNTVVVKLRLILISNVLLLNSDIIPTLITL